MSEQLSSLEPLITLSGEGVQAQLIDDFESYLMARGHTPRTQELYGTAVAHFIQWLYEQPTEKQHVDAQSVRTFLQAHLPSCRCTQPGSRDLKSVRAALNQLLLMLGGDRLRPAVPSDPPAIAALVDQFDVYLDQVCGLAEATRWYHRRYTRTFLRRLFGDTPVNCGQISAEDLRRFVYEQACGQQPGSVGVIAYSLRTFLRFLQLKGDVGTELIRAVPSPPHWSLASLPPSLNDAELESFWAAFDRRTAVGRRDYAMARCLADLGLRCQEVANLHLDDIDWRDGTVCLSESKSRRVERLPLPQLTGAALVDYLSHGRPVTASRSVFVLHRAPMGQAATNTTVRGAIRRAFERAGLPWSGTHILRHTAATRMVQGGASLKEVADVLGHRSIDTTLIYTKVDLPQLSRIALPWPGRRP
jgi:site-specific recombinase XerD